MSTHFVNIIAYIVSLELNIINYFEALLLTGQSTDFKINI